MRVKGGHATVSQVRDLRGVIERDDAAIGVFVTLEPPTGPMKKEAAEAGFWQTKSLAGCRRSTGPDEREIGRLRARLERLASR